ncbi:vacuolar protein sorting-associated protein 27-like isoform X2 [Ceratina calcarata]|uniref:Vacuolar protein sorting-associated protein 27-like isoform X2 n=1 Tax=Ceratina calcarata TaxID=156304 RepID=A0AAJ7SCY2_9HYME|nr:vacuolar protein sorting-associated protein 27-like isoform X2 [Ceratina calcarata]
MRIIILVIPLCLLLLTEAKRAEIRPRVAEPQVYYEEDDSQAAEDDYSSPVYQTRTRALHSPRSKDALHSSRPPPVQTIRNYNKVNDDGSFTFGYEAADGSFKEETRGTDCVVRGKYGYVDPDGNKREFTYVSGNPCDPNAPKDEDDLADEQKEDELSGPANYPSVRPVPRPVRPSYQQSTTRAPTTIFQSHYKLDDDASQELGDEDVVRPSQLRENGYRGQQPSYVPVTPSTALYEPSPTASPALYRIASSTTQYQSTASPILRSQPTVSSTAYQTHETTTRRPVTRHPRPQSVAITPRPHVAQVAAQYVSPSSTERAALSYTRAPSSAATVSSNSRTTPASAAAHLDFAAELERYVNTVSVAPTPKPQAQASKVKLSSQSAGIGAPAADPIYQSELIYDPSTAQPQSYYGLQQLQQIQPQQPQRQSPLYKATQQSQTAPAPAAQPQEVLYRKQQSQLLQQSQQLYAQQQRRQQQQQQQQQPLQSQRLQFLESQPQSFYYVAPARSSNAASAPLSAGQIDQYLRANAGRY